MRIYRNALLALLTVIVGAACGNARDVPDTGRTNPYKCDTCHGYPPAASYTSLVDGQEKHHPQGITPEQCAVCHPGTVQTDGHTFVVAGQHRDGQAEAVPFADLACTACHGSPPETGSHLFHVQNQHLTCADCHKGFTSTTVDASLHMNGTHDVILPSGAAITAANLPDKSWPSSECQECHSKLQ